MCHRNHIYQLLFSNSKSKQRTADGVTEIARTSLLLVFRRADRLCSRSSTSPRSRASTEPFNGSECGSAARSGSVGPDDPSRFRPWIRCGFSASSSSSAVYGRRVVCPLWTLKVVTCFSRSDPRTRMPPSPVGEEHLRASQSTVQRRLACSSAGACGRSVATRHIGRSRGRKPARLSLQERKEHGGSSILGSGSIRTTSSFTRRRSRSIIVRARTPARGAPPRTRRPKRFADWARTRRGPGALPEEHRGDTGRAWGASDRGAEGCADPPAGSFVARHDLVVAAVNATVVRDEGVRKQPTPVSSIGTTTPRISPRPRLGARSHGMTTVRTTPRVIASNRLA